MSGYTTEAIGQYGIMHAGAPFVGKPFTASLLSQKVREALDYRSPFKRPAAAHPVLDPGPRLMHPEAAAG